MRTKFSLGWLIVPSDCELADMPRDELNIEIIETWRIPSDFLAKCSLGGHPAESDFRQVFY